LEGAVRRTDEAGSAVSDLTAGSLWTCGPQTPHRLEVRTGSRVLNIHDPALKQAAPSLTIDRQDGLGFVLTRHLVGSGDNVKFEADGFWLALLVCSGQAAGDSRTA
tara:strand:- start:3008 stop:3325 length:318 start_codon:yes stop_codon:yes gene_type:complete